MKINGHGFPLPEKRLLITSCTRRKNTHVGSLSAWKRYEGGCFPLLKQLQASGYLLDDVTFFIISAKYGLLRPEDSTELYDQCMTDERASMLHDSITNQMRSHLAQTVYTQTCILLEPIYMQCLHGLDFASLTYLDCFSTEHLFHLQQWLLPQANSNDSVQSGRYASIEKREAKPYQRCKT
jgi:hypothetical protein